MKASEIKNHKEKEIKEFTNNDKNYIYSCLYQTLQQQTQ